jgi:hypothetical protein
VDGERRVFECTRCGHVGPVYTDPPRCRKCGFQTGVIKLVGLEESRRLFEQNEARDDKPAG